MPTFPRLPAWTLEKWIRRYGRTPNPRPIPFTSEPDSGPDIRQSIAPEMLAPIVIKPVPDVVADQDEEPECPAAASPTPGEMTMTDTDHDRMPKFKGMPQNLIDEILAKRLNAKPDLSPRVKRPRPDFEALAKRYNFGADGDEMTYVDISIEDLELLRQEADERKCAAKDHPAGNAPDA